jgi:hypothetical protein
MSVIVVYFLPKLECKSKFYQNLSILNFMKILQRAVLEILRLQRERNMDKADFSKSRAG